MYGLTGRNSKDLQDNKFYGFEGTPLALPSTEHLNELGLKPYVDNILKTHINPQEAFDAFNRALENDNVKISESTRRSVLSWLQVRDQLGLLASWDRQVERFGRQQG